MEEEPYEAESLLQRLLADYPDLLAGDQMRPTAPRRWLLVSRELSVPDEESVRSRWSLDHLFIDQEGIPTLVEVKRSSNTQVRREVVGQMLDYAANGTLYWSLEQITAALNRRCERDGVDPEMTLGAAQRLLDWANARELDIKWGTGTKNGSFSPKGPLQEEVVHLFSVYTDYNIQFAFAAMRVPPFDRPERRRELADRLGAIDARLQFDDSKLDGWPFSGRGVVVAPAAVDAFLSVWDWYLDEVNRT